MNTDKACINLRSTIYDAGTRKMLKKIVNRKSKIVNYIIFNYYLYERNFMG